MRFELHRYLYLYDDRDLQIRRSDRRRRDGLIKRHNRLHEREVDGLTDGLNTDHQCVDHSMYKCGISE